MNRHERGRRVARAGMLLAGLALAASGALPLLLYVLLGPADGNPIGLGLWAVVAVPVGLILAVFGAVRWLIRHFLRERA